MMFPTVTRPRSVQRPAVVSVNWGSEQARGLRFAVHGQSVRNLVTGDDPIVAGASTCVIGPDGPVLSGSSNYYYAPVGLTSPAITLAGWVCVPAWTGANQSVVGGWRLDSGQSPWSLMGIDRQGASDLLSFLFANYQDPQTITVAFTPSSAWVHLCQTVAANSQVAYINGREVGRSYHPYAFNAYGYTAVKFERLSSGVLQSDVRVWNRALTPQEVYNLWSPDTRWDLYHQSKPQIVVPTAYAPSESLGFRAAPAVHVLRRTTTKPIGKVRLDRSHHLSAGLITCVPLTEGQGGFVDNLTAEQPMIATTAGIWSMTGRGLTYKAPTRYERIVSSIQYSEKVRLAVGATQRMSFACGFVWQPQDYQTPYMLGCEGNSGEARWGFQHGYNAAVMSSVLVTTGSTNNSIQVSMGGATRYVVMVSTYDGTTHRAYLNGVEVGSVDPGGAMPWPYLAITKLYIAGRYNGDYNWNQGVDFGYAWSRCLSPQEVARLTRSPYEFLIQPSPLKMIIVPSAYPGQRLRLR